MWFLNNSISITRSMLDMHSPQPHTSPTEPNAVSVQPGKLCFRKFSNTLMLKDTCAGMSIPQEVTDCVVPGENKENYCPL